MTLDKLRAEQIGFIIINECIHVNNPEGLDRWIDKRVERKVHFSKSVLTEEQITLHSLKERISELENMRDHIQYELDKLKSLEGQQNN